MENVVLNGRTVSWSGKSLLRVSDGVVHFADADWFNTVTGKGTHRYGYLSVTGQSVIIHATADDPTFTETGLYAITYPPM